MYVRLRGITKLSHLSNSLFVFSQILPLQTATANILLRNLENYALGENVHSRKGGRQVSNRGSCPAAAVWLKLHLVRWAGRDLAQTEARDSRWAGYCCARLLCAFSPSRNLICLSLTPQYTGQSMLERSSGIYFGKGISVFVPYLYCYKAVAWSYMVGEQAYAHLDREIRAKERHSVQNHKRRQQWSRM